LQEKPHVPLAQEGCAWVTEVMQMRPHMPQWLGLLAVLTHVAPQSVGVAPEQPVTQAYVAPDGEHAGMALGHMVPHPPQLAALDMSVSQP